MVEQYANLYDMVDGNSLENIPWNYYKQNPSCSPWLYFPDAMTFCLAWLRLTMDFILQPPLCTHSLEQNIHRPLCHTWPQQFCPSIFDTAQSVFRL